MVLNKNIHEFDDMEKKQNIFEKIYYWFVGDDREYQKLMQELDCWKQRASRYEKKYKILLRRVKNEETKKSK